MVRVGGVESQSGVGELNPNLGVGGVESQSGGWEDNLEDSGSPLNGKLDWPGQITDLSNLECVSVNSRAFPGHRKCDQIQSCVSESKYCHALAFLTLTDHFLASGRDFKN